ncbi:LCP family protein [Streptomyces griseoviridis]|uniref:Transcriptional regulator n=1 Tax=Streptomyces griseoviridis TaxID=45398 RepID=A0A3S9ZGK7_STRGD|nr:MULTISPECIES: LCP family protein [Streptomyces]AZS86850.1 LytR family transcriptional regulator [Streptomyces griseoviridis]MDH6701907.1 LCP family protein required for cell wall assembly [Streptomyces sp. MAA16]QCN86292.1 transcriptional regulator [Streptomyces griseoviridis]
MSEWPDAWSDQNRRNQRGGGSASAQPEGPRVMRQVRRPDAGGHGAPRPAAPPYGGVPQQPSYGDGQGQGGYGQGGYQDGGYNTGQVYGGPGGGGPGGRGPGGGAPRPDWRRRIKWTAATVVAVLVVTTVGTYFWADSKLHRDVDLSKVIDRPEAGEGTNYLIVGSDSRAGMSDEDKKKLHTGSAEGQRTDSMMILHVGGSGDTLISLPRDSNVTIPTFKGSESGKVKGPLGPNKLNAAYAFDGPTLLVRTVEYNTGLHIDHYVEIGFAGFANIVDAVGGVDIEIDKAFKDKYSGADFQAGKQTLDGQQALAFVRTRHAFAASDLQRTKNQQKFLSALAHQVATPSTVLNPFKLYPTLGAGLDSLTVDKDMSLWDLASMFWAMKGVSGGDGTSMNMPISGSTGGNLVWDKAKVKTLVDELNNDQKVTVTSD